MREIEYLKPFQFKKGYKGYWLGKHHYEETKKKISQTLKGTIPWNKGTKGMICPNSGSFKKGEHRGFNTEFKKEDIRLIKENNVNWKGGITPLNTKLRSSWKVRQWIKAVFERDNYTCLNCGKRGYKLHAHHIKSWSDYPKLRTDINNGITLCKNCHG